MVKKKVKTRQEGEREVDYTKHPNYDEITIKMRKLLGAAKLFIPDACEALRKDWYPELTQEQIKNDSEKRSRIHDRIMEDWGRDENHVEGIWAKSSMYRSGFPDWVKNPKLQSGEFLEAAFGNLSKANKQLRANELEIQEQKPAIERLIQKLPEPIPEPQEQIPELKIPEEPIGSNEPLDPSEAREINIHQADTELTAAEQAILKALKSRRHLFHEIASGSNKNLARLAINGHIEKLGQIRKVVDDSLAILQEVTV